MIRAVWPEPDPALTEKTMRNLLGSFGIHGETCDQPVKELSGGERSRAALAKLTVAGTNVLILDEPTNHLDLWACDSLEEALKNYEGTCLVVSHDRYFLNRVVDLLIVFEPNRIEMVYGNFDTYELLRANRENAAKEAAEKAAPKKEAATKTAVVAPGGKRKRKYPYRKAGELETEIAELEAKMMEMETTLTLPEVYRDGERVQELMHDIAEAQARLPELYEHWEEATEMNG